MQSSLRIFMRMSGILVFFSMYNVHGEIPGALRSFLNTAHELIEETVFDAAEPTEQMKPFYGPPKPLVKAQNNAQDNNDGLLKLIQWYSPILYLNTDERYLPISAEEYFTSADASVNKVETPGRKVIQGKLIKPGKEVIGKGEVTFEKLYDLYKENKTYNPNLYVKIPDYTKFGSNPANNTNKKGVLTTPAYVVAYNQNGKTYIQYIFLYGFNKPYKIEDLYLGAHEADLEHFTLEIDPKTKQITRLLYQSHGTDDGIEITRQKDFEKEGSHPIIYLANGGHGNYPGAGTYVRMLGFANDITEKGLRWEPKFIRVYPDSDKRFDPKSMGWLYFPGNYGARGVASVVYKNWFMQGATEPARPLSGIAFCKDSDSACVARMTRRELATFAAKQLDKL